MLWQLSEKALPPVATHHHHGNLETDAVMPRVSGAVHAPRPGAALHTQLLQTMPGEDHATPELSPRQWVFPLPAVQEGKEG